MTRRVGQIRQGDVLLSPAKDVAPPQDVERMSEVVLAEGEQTGHAHRINAGVILEWNMEGQRYVRVEDNTPGLLAHEDHDPIPAPVIEPGVTYRVVPQYELSLEDEWERVLD